MRHIVWILILWTLPSFSQDGRVDSVYYESSSLKSLKIATKLVDLDPLSVSDFSTFSLGKLLQSESPFYIKEYGNGLLSTISMRGLASAHTKVLWNGISLNSSQNGGVDFNLINLRSLDKASYVSGGNSSIVGSGSVGGSILLGNSPRFREEKTLILNGLVGSFGHLSYGLDSRLSKKKWDLSFGFKQDASDNNYSYIYNLKKREVKNAAYKQLHNYVNVFYKLGQKSRLQLSINKHKSTRNIIETKGSDSKAQQKDVGLQSVLKYRLESKKYDLDIYQSFIYDDLEYFDHRDNPRLSYSRNRRYESGINFRYIFNKRVRLNTNSRYQYINSYSTGYGHRDVRSYNLNLGAEGQWKKWWYHGALEYLIHSEYEVPFTFSTTLGYGKSHHLWHISMSKNYRVPSFNDLYWQPGGNEDLVPESGYMYDLNYVFRLESRKETPLEFKQSFYVSSFNNWIQWSPSSAGFWRAENYKQVKGYGLESRLSYRESKGFLALKVDLNYGYVKSIDSSTDKQLIYVPFHKISGKLNLDFHKKYRFIYQHSLSSKLYTLRDHSAEIKGASSGSLQFVYHPKTEKKIGYKVGFKINNLYNNPYEFVEGRPMPGRELLVNLNIKLK